MCWKETGTSRRPHPMPLTFSKWLDVSVCETSSRGSRKCVETSQCFRPTNLRPPRERKWGGKCGSCQRGPHIVT